ncbi:hypothetical protein Hanom_Chr11g01007061 [Helianthus anomalus]
MVLCCIWDGLGEGDSMLDQAGNGKLRVSVSQSKLATKVAKKYVFLVKNVVFLRNFNLSI